MARASASDTTVAEPEPGDVGADHKRDRRPNITPEEKVALQAIILQKLREGGTTQDAIRATGRVGWPQVRRWMTADPAFAAAVAQAREEGAEGRLKRLSEINAHKMGRLRGDAWEKAHPDAAKKGRKATRSRPSLGTHRWAHWLPEEDALLRRLAGTMPVREIVGRLAALRGDGHVRSERSIRQRAMLLDLSLLPRELLSMSGVQAILGSFASVVTAVGRGLLTPTWEHPRSDGLERLFSPADVERFLREHPYAYDPDRLGRGRLADLGRVIHRADPWLTVPEVRDYLDIRQWRLNALIKDGELVPKRRLWSHGANGGGVRVFRRSEVVAYARDRLRKGA